MSEIALRHSSRQRTLSFLVAVVMVAAALPKTSAYKSHIPKITRSHGLTRLSESMKEHATHEEKYALRRPTKKRSSNSKVAMHSAVIDHSIPAFERRMRDVMFPETKKTKQQQRPSHLPPNVHMVKSLEDYKRIVGEERDQLVVARFYAPWCKACRAIQPMYYRLATKFTNVKFVEVPVNEENAALHQGLGVPSLPYGHIYSPSVGLVEELKISRPRISEFATKLQSYVVGSCELSNGGDSSSPYQSSQADDDADKDE